MFAKKIDIEKKNVVIIGSGFAGIKMFKELSALKKKHDFLNPILIGEMPYFYIAPTGLRAIVDPRWIDRTLLPIEEVKNVIVNGSETNFIQGKVVGIKEGNDSQPSKVELEGGRFVPYDYCVLATGLGQTELGRAGEGNVERAAIQAHFQTLNEKLRRASKIAIAGGGPNGLEMAGEIKDAFPEKEVAILHSGPRFLSSNIRPVPSRLVSDLETKVRSLGIEVYFNTRVKVPWKENRADVTDKLAIELKEEAERTILVENDTKKVHDVDLLLVSINRMIPKDSTDVNPLYDSLPDASHELRGQIKVNKYLQVPGYEGNNNNVYALGDVAATGAQKFVMATDEQAKVISTNMLAQIKGQTPEKEYQPSSAPNAMIIPLGEKRGWGYFGLFGFFEILVRTIKGKNLLADMVWKGDSKTGSVPNLSP